MANREYLKRGDLVKIAKELNIGYQKVRDVLRGEVKEQAVIIAIDKLNEARKKEAEELAKKAVENIINS